MINLKDKLIQFVLDRDLPFVDKRPKGGGFWVIGGKDIGPTLNANPWKVMFHFKEGGNKSTQFLSAWWTNHGRGMAD